MTIAAADRALGAVAGGRCRPGVHSALKRTTAGGKVSNPAYLHSSAPFVHGIYSASEALTARPGPAGGGSPPPTPASGRATPDTEILGVTVAVRSLDALRRVKRAAERPRDHTDIEDLDANGQ